jgi:hypothetical protein
VAFGFRATSICRVHRFAISAVFGLYRSLRGRAPWRSNLFSVATPCVIFVMYLADPDFN